MKLVCADYVRLLPLAGKLVPAPFDLALGRDGSWIERAQLLRRALTDPAVDGGEASMGMHLRRIDAGDRSHVALPIFVLRNFTARDLYVRRGASTKTATDLAGARIGMYSWSASGSIWYRHFLAWIGVDPAAVRWCIGDVDGDSYTAQPDPSLPPGVMRPPPGRSLSDMLLDGELDAIYSPPRPHRYHPADGPIVRLFPDSRQIETAYFRATGVFPPQHIVVLRRAVWEADRSMARRITDAFIACEAAFRASACGFPYASAWHDQDLEAQEAALGSDPYAHGVAANRSVMEQFAQQAQASGLTRRVIDIEDYFAEFLAS